MTGALSSSPLAPDSTIGILGGGQLGRMLAQAAAQLGLHTHIYCPNKQAPAFEVANAQTIADFDDDDALREFAQNCDTVTFEFENIPLHAADLVAGITPFYPGRKALDISQDRGTEKSFLQELGIRVADWWPIENAADLATAMDECGAKAVLKTRRLGYDGKGQVTLAPQSDPAKALSQLENQPAILERMIPFEREVSVVLVRSLQGDVSCYDIPCNHHEGGILRRSTIPCNISPKLTQSAKEAATKIATALDYIGVLAVEFFVTNDGDSQQLLVNEFAPRVHNTGHWTLDACICSQFENHIRAVAGWPLGATQRHSNAVMTNLLGPDVMEWQTLASQPNLALHLYGKTGTQEGRKLGHKTQISRKTD